MYLAHSSEIKIQNKVERVIPSQPYEEHVSNLQLRISDILAEEQKFLPKDLFHTLQQIVHLAAEYHDFGKLDRQSQLILGLPPTSDKDKLRMLNHVDAGVAFLIKKYKEHNDEQYILAAILVLAHHIGLENLDSIRGSDTSSIRVKHFYKFRNMRDNSETSKYLSDKKDFEFLADIVSEHVNLSLSEYDKIHHSLRGSFKHKPLNPTKVKSLFKFIPMRYMLSVLIDADHYDTANHYESYYPSEGEPLNANERRKTFDKKLDELIANKFSKKLSEVEGERVAIRNELRSCSESYDFDSNVFPMYTMSGLVGSGKTFSLPIAALNMAEVRGLRRMFYAVPYIALVDQTYAECSELLFIKDKSKEVNIIHSMVDYGNGANRMYAKGFNSPVNMLTSISLLDVFISNKTSVIRNFHKVIGSVFVFDEFDKVANLEHWSVLTGMIKDVNSFGSTCFILGSGSPNKYWESKDLNMKRYFDDEDLSNEDSEIVSPELYEKMLKMEDSRVTINTDFLKRRLEFKDLKDLVVKKNGSKFIVFTTVFKAVEFAKYLEDNTNQKVFCRHSGASPLDREAKYKEIKSAMESEDITLVATEGSDIGLDLSFDHAFKEAASYSAKIQISGRVNRHFEKEDATVTVFRLARCPLNNGVVFHDNMALSSATKAYLWNIGRFQNHSPLNCTEFMNFEIDIRKKSTLDSENFLDKVSRFQKMYKTCAFRDFNLYFKIIENEQISIIIDKSIVERIENGEDVSYSELQMNSVNRMIGDSRMELLFENEKLIEVGSKDLSDYGERFEKKYSDWYLWNGEYNEDFGIMADDIWSQSLR